MLTGSWKELFPWTRLEVHQHEQPKGPDFWKDMLIGPQRCRRVWRGPLKTLQAGWRPLSRRTMARRRLRDDVTVALYVSKAVYMSNVMQDLGLLTEFVSPPSQRQTGMVETKEDCVRVNTRKKKRVIPPDGLMNAMEIIDERGFKMQAEAKREVSWNHRWRWLRLFVANRGEDELVVQREVGTKYTVQDETQDKTIELKSIGCRHDV
ncbi:hypothetical protein CPAR01_03672 [Colletotrichum paranaense]|uniref:Uncharacterized protein n=1 Tax=Colletotrichum paranaense TaxID=1914294 RepID=A0ABQ9SUV9_9PEZI|nr:uncharacterized protein CPAR01_03672 [Colletotrichum paranaense]KAK1543039.1 hypothetical protein CPAR01_03672 [Colletotrichum paranaense]